MESAAKKRATVVREGTVAQAVRTCWVIYQKAADAYRVLANNAMSDEISQLWRNMAEGMNKHILYWKKISERVEKDPTVEALGNPHEVLEQLRDVEAKIDRIQQSCTAFRSVMDYFYLAYSIEVQLTHPVLSSLPESML